MLTPIQEIKVISKDGNALNITLEIIKNISYATYTLDGQDSGFYGSLVECYEDAILKAIAILKAKNETLLFIDNICNTEFLDKVTQLSILSLHQINAAVLVNGK